MDYDPYQTLNKVACSALSLAFPNLRPQVFEVDHELRRQERKNGILAPRSCKQSLMNRNQARKLARPKPSGLMVPLHHLW